MQRARVGWRERGEMAAAATGWWVGRTEGGEAAVVAGEPFGSDNGKHSFSLRVSVHQCRGPGGGRGPGFVSSRLTLDILMVMPPAPSSQVVQQIKWAVFNSSPPRKRERGYKTVNSGVWAYLGIWGFSFFLILFWDKVLLRN